MPIFFEDSGLSCQEFRWPLASTCSNNLVLYLSVFYKLRSDVKDHSLNYWRVNFPVNFKEASCQVLSLLWIDNSEQFTKKAEFRLPYFIMKLEDEEVIIINQIMQYWLLGERWHRMSTNAWLLKFSYVDCLLQHLCSLYFIHHHHEVLSSCWQNELCS